MSLVDYVEELATALERVEPNLATAVRAALPAWLEARRALKLEQHQAEVVELARELYLKSALFAFTSTTTGPRLQLLEPAEALRRARAFYAVAWPPEPLSSSDELPSPVEAMRTRDTEPPASGDR